MSLILKISGKLKKVPTKCFGSVIALTLVNAQGEWKFFIGFHPEKVHGSHLNMNATGAEFQACQDKISGARAIVLSILTTVL